MSEKNFSKPFPWTALFATSLALGAGFTAGHLFFSPEATSNEKGLVGVFNVGLSLLGFAGLLGLSLRHRNRPAPLRKSRETLHSTQLSKWIKTCERSLALAKPKTALLQLECLRRTLFDDESKSDRVTDLQSWLEQLATEAREMAIPVVPLESAPPLWAFLDAELLRAAVLNLVLTFSNENRGASVPGSRIVLKITSPRNGTSGAEIQVGWSFAPWNSPLHGVSSDDSLALGLALSASTRHGFSLKEVREGSQTLGYVFTMGHERIADFSAGIPPFEGHRV